MRKVTGVKLITVRCENRYFICKSVASETLLIFQSLAYRRRSFLLQSLNSTVIEVAFSVILLAHMKSPTGGGGLWHVTV